MSDTRALASSAEVSEHLRVPVQTLYNWRVRGLGPRAIRVGKHLRYRWSDVEAWLEQQAESSAGQASAPQEAS